MIKKLFKYISIIILGYIFLCLITPFNKFLRNRSIKNQITYLSNILDEGYDDKLQSRFPEGKLFSNAILSLSIIEYCDKNNISQEKYSKILDNCIRRIQSESTLDIFNPTIDPPYGMFYNGWSNYVYKKYRNSLLYKYSKLKDTIEKASKNIEERLTKAQSDSIQILDSYNGSNWPADNLIGIISLENDNLKQMWTNKILNTTEHHTGLVHHSGRNTYNIRGSSTAMITFCLNELNYKNIGQYNNQFRKTFIDEYLGVQLVKENKNGSNEMDVDSGPVLFGYGASATIMNIKTQASLHSVKSKNTWAVMNLISFPINIFKKKYYLFKQEPMYDLFMLWGSTELN